MTTLGIYHEKIPATAITTIINIITTAKVENPFMTYLEINY